MWKVWADVYLPCDVNSNSHQADFHETLASSTTARKIHYTEYNETLTKVFVDVLTSQTDTVGMSGGRSLYQAPSSYFAAKAAAYKMM